MRAVRWIRNYALAVFFVVLAGGVLLRPGQGDLDVGERLGAGPAAGLGPAVASPPADPAFGGAAASARLGGRAVRSSLAARLR